MWGGTAKQVVNAWLWTSSAAAGHLTRVLVCVSGWQAASAQAAQAPAHSLAARQGNSKGAPAGGPAVVDAIAAPRSPSHPPARGGRPPPCRRRRLTLSRGIGINSEPASLQAGSNLQLTRCFTRRTRARPAYLLTGALPLAEDTANPDDAS